jgi:molybdenum cofactor cytidylyltransferase
MAGATIATEIRARHETGALVEAIQVAARDADLVIVFGASAITDRRDVIPSAILGAGGIVEHLGMPVDPGNLLLLGALPVAPDGSIPVIGAPGCARSPKENGFDFVLRRLLAGLGVTSADLRGMGVGGLLNEIVTRPQPRAPGDTDTNHG